MLKPCKRDSKGRLLKVDNKPVPKHLKSVRVPPAWTNVKVADKSTDKVWASGTDEAGRLQRLYSPEHTKDASERKFVKIRRMLLEHEEIRSQIELDMKDKSLSLKQRLAATCLYLIYETGIRPGSTADTKGAVKAYGATTLQLRHIKVMASGRVRLRFTGKKGVAQNILVTNPYLVEWLEKRKAETTAWTTTVFNCSSSLLNTYCSKFGYSAKDFRTMRGTIIATDLLTGRRIPKVKARAKRALNKALDVVAKHLGNTRAVARSSYVDPLVIQPWNSVIKGTK